MGGYIRIFFIPITLLRTILGGTYPLYGCVLYLFGGMLKNTHTHVDRFVIDYIVPIQYGMANRPPRRGVGLPIPGKNLSDGRLTPQQLLKFVSSGADRTMEAEPLTRIEQGNRSGCESLTLAMRSPHSVPCRHGNTACIITRGVETDPTRSPSLYSGSRSACGDLRRHDAGVARTAKPDLAELLTPPIKRPAPPRAATPSSESSPSWWSTGPSWLYAHPHTCGRSR